MRRGTYLVATPNVPRTDGSPRGNVMRQFQLHVAFSAPDENDARRLSEAVETMVSCFCHSDPWSVHTTEETQVYASAPKGAPSALSVTDFVPV